MAWTLRKLRIVSVLCLALVGYAATPHFHADHEPPARSPELRATATSADPGDGDAGRDGSDPGGVRATRAPLELSPDDSHADHSSSLALDAHPCALCRDKSGRELAALQPASIRLEPCADPRGAPTCEETSVERLFIGRAPARAPPLA